MTQIEAKAAVQKYGSQVKAAKALGMPRATFGEYFRGVHKKARAENKGVCGATEKHVKKASDFRALFHKGTIIPSKIKKAIAAMAPGEWKYESEFAHDAQISVSDIAKYREPFADNIVFIQRESKRVWAKTAALATELRGML